MRIHFSAILLIGCAFGITSCGEKPISTMEHPLTRADSITSTYLSFQDTLHNTWNMMINDDNQKISSMHNLLHELIISHPEDLEKYAPLEERLEQLTRMRFTQKSMANTDVIEEYDFATASLVSELLAEATSKREFAYNPTLQRLVETIHIADERTSNYRFEYDSIVAAYNDFVEQNKAFLLENDPTISIDKKPVFEVAYE